jgi:hypothetical protein
MQGVADTMQGVADTMQGVADTMQGVADKFRPSMLISCVKKNLLCKH